MDSPWPKLSIADPRGLGDARLVAFLSGAWKSAQMDFFIWVSHYRVADRLGVTEACEIWAQGGVHEEPKFRNDLRFLQGVRLFTEAPALPPLWWVSS